MKVKDSHIHVTEAITVLSWEDRTMRRMEVDPCSTQPQKQLLEISDLWDWWKALIFLSAREHKGATINNQKWAPGTTLVFKWHTGLLISGDFYFICVDHNTLTKSISVERKKISMAFKSITANLWLQINLSFWEPQEYSYWCFTKWIVQGVGICD